MAVAAAASRSPTAVPAPACAPVVLFAYKRADHLRRTIESLRRNPEAASTELHVYCDGARSPADRAAVDAVRAFVDGLDGFAAVRRTHRAQNMGLARSVIAGVSEVLEAHPRVVVLEDDLVLSPHFLRYMNAALDCYDGDAEVASIHGYCYPTGEALDETFFLRGADCWGWATWRRAWARFEPDGRRLLEALQARRLTRPFDYDGAYPYTAMLENQVAGRNDSWAIRWHASCFLADMLTLYPGRTLVENIGNDASGTHCEASATFAQAVAEAPVTVERIARVESVRARDAFRRFFRRQQPPPSIAARAGRLLKGWTRRAA